MWRSAGARRGSYGSGLLLSLPSWMLSSWKWFRDTTVRLVWLLWAGEAGGVRALTTGDAVSGNN